MCYITRLINSRLIQITIRGLKDEMSRLRPENQLGQDSLSCVQVQTTNVVCSGSADRFGSGPADLFSS
jgi:hypothetical protein